MFETYCIPFNVQVKTMCHSMSNPMRGHFTNIESTPKSSGTWAYCLELAASPSQSFVENATLVSHNLLALFIFRCTCYVLCSWSCSGTSSFPTPEQISQIEYLSTDGWSEVAPSALPAFGCLGQAPTSKTEATCSQRMTQTGKNTCPVCGWLCWTVWIF